MRVVRKNGLFHKMTFQIQNRRYLGNKNKLLNFIEEKIKENCLGCKSFADVFAGTGTVANHFKNEYQIMLNDLLYSNYVVYQCFFGDEEVHLKKVEDILFHYNNKREDIQSGKIQSTNNYYLNNFKNTYLSTNNLKVVNYVREDIDNKRTLNEINEREKFILIASLLFAIDKVAVTTGHYDAFLKDDNNRLRNIIFDMPDIKTNEKASIERLDANDFVRKYSADIIYLDPPYNSRQYSDLYHFLENVAENKHPELFGKTKKFDRTNIKSNYCTSKAEEQFDDLIENIKAKYIILSFNNTENSSVRISRKKIEETLSRKGILKVFEKDYKTYTTGKTKINGLKELLFICEVK